MKALIGTKLGMTQILGEDGTATPVTIVQAGPCTITQLKSLEKDGYQAIQIGFGENKNAAKPQTGHTKAAKVSPKIMKEIRITEPSEELTLGAQLDVSLFNVGDMVDVTGTSKGKGFAGTIKRHNFERQRKTHGGDGNTRKVGSIGSMYPQKVFKGKRMAGRMGHDQVTVKNLVVAYVDTENNLIGLKGAVPGPRKGTVVIGGVK